ncbi:hypothetical protein HID58_023001 [Brassica napus]|uniref:Uncharacterized protein n=1 Tax=Brassica napus TaxID=3708 RepID=A0ABQ8D166_BRANA|nr:hypothetical protein HID58_023001 [Brassica napus]
MFELLHARDSIRSVIASLRWRLCPSPAEIRELVFPLPYSSLTSFKLKKICLNVIVLVQHFGKEIIAKELNVDQDHPDVLRLFLAVYKSFMEAIDAVDNGINRYDTDQPPRYVNNTHLSSRVGRLNLDWIDPDQSQEKENEAFKLAMALAGKEFLQSLRFHARSWLSARSIVMQCLEERFKTDPSGEIMELKNFCPVSAFTVHSSCQCYSQ